MSIITGPIVSCLLVVTPVYRQVTNMTTTKVTTIVSDMNFNLIGSFTRFSSEFPLQLFLVFVVMLQTHLVKQ